LGEGYNPKNIFYNRVHRIFVFLFSFVGGAAGGPPPPPQPLLGCPPVSWHKLLTYLLTPWCRVLEKLTGLQLVKKLPAFHGTRRFITAAQQFKSQWYCHPLWLYVYGWATDDTACRVVVVVVVPYQPVVNTSCSVQDAIWNRGLSSLSCRHLIANMYYVASSVHQRPITWLRFLCIDWRQEFAMPSVERIFDVGGTAELFRGLIKLGNHDIGV